MIFSETCIVYELAVLFVLCFESSDVRSNPVPRLSAFLTSSFFHHHCHSFLFLKFRHCSLSLSNRWPVLLQERAWQVQLPELGQSNGHVNADVRSHVLIADHLASSFFSKCTTPKRSYANISQSDDGHCILRRSSFFVSKVLTSEVLTSVQTHFLGIVTSSFFHLVSLLVVLLLQNVVVIVVCFCSSSSVIVRSRFHLYLLRFILTSVHTFLLEMSWVREIVPLLGKYVYPTALLVQTLSIYLTLLVAVQRYVCLCRPHRASVSCKRRQMRRYVVG